MILGQMGSKTSFESLHYIVHQDKFQMVQRFKWEKKKLKIIEKKIWYNFFITWKWGRKKYVSVSRSCKR